MSLDNLEQSECVCANAVCVCARVVPEEKKTDIQPGIDIIIYGNVFSVNKQLIAENSKLISDILDEDPLTKNIDLPFIVENKWVKEFGYFFEFLKYKYVDVPKPLPEKGEHFTKENCGSDANVNFINNFYDKTIINEKNKLPVELINSLCLANYLGATKFLNVCCAKFASVLIELELAKIN